MWARNQKVNTGSQIVRRIGLQEFLFNYHRNDSLLSQPISKPITHFQIISMVAYTSKCTIHHHIHEKMSY